MASIILLCSSKRHIVRYKNNGGGNNGLCRGEQIIAISVNITKITGDLNADHPPHPHFFLSVLFCDCIIKCYYYYYYQYLETLVVYFSLFQQKKCNKGNLLVNYSFNSSFTSRDCLKLKFFKIFEKSSLHLQVTQTAFQFLLIGELFGIGEL